VTEDAKRRFARADQCWICKGVFTLVTNEHIISAQQEKIRILT
jgi:hypothetical protein